MLEQSREVGEQPRCSSQGGSGLSRAVWHWHRRHTGRRKWAVFHVHHSRPHHKCGVNGLRKNPLFPPPPSIPSLPSVPCQMLSAVPGCYISGCQAPRGGTQGADPARGDSALPAGAEFIFLEREVESAFPSLERSKRLLILQLRGKVWQEHMGG